MMTKLRSCVFVGMGVESTALLLRLLEERPAVISISVS